MKALIQVLTSSLGRKYIMGITGFALVAFVIIHMLGNLQIFLGEETLNTYAHLLKASAEFLWVFRLGLLAMVVLHLAAAISLVMENKKARGKAYVKEQNSASWASRTMAVSGIIVLSFVIYHLLHFTAHVVDPGFSQLLDENGKPDVYRMVIVGFSNVWISGFYIVGVGLLCWHMSHGVSSMFQSLGFRNARSAPLLDKLAIAVAVVIFLGMTAVPTAVLFKIVS